jgi:hypothetical protein
MVNILSLTEHLVVLFKPNWEELKARDKETWSEGGL